MKAQVAAEGHSDNLPSRWGECGVVGPRFGGIPVLLMWGGGGGGGCSVQLVVDGV